MVQPAYPAGRRDPEFHNVSSGARGVQGPQQPRNLIRLSSCVRLEAFQPAETLTDFAEATVRNAIAFRRVQTSAQRDLEFSRSGSSRTGVIGSSRTRTPTASKTALATAASTPVAASSPMPRAPIALACGSY